MPDILIIKTSSLGDVVHMMPAITDVARAVPGVRMSWVVEEAFAPLARLHPAVNDVIPVATRRWRSQLMQRDTWHEIAGFAASLREPDFDKVVDTQGLIRSAVIAKLAHGERHGYDADSIREPLAARFYDVTHRVGRAQHAVTRNRLLTGLSLGYQSSAAIDYGLPAAERADEQPYALLLHGTSRPSKEWRAEHWVEAGRWLQGRGLQVVLPWGTEPERQTAEQLSAAIEGSRVLPRQRLDLTAQVIAGSSLVIGVDTGLLHLAAAYRVPLIGIYVATDPGLTGPVGSGSISVLGGKSGGPSARQAIDAAEQLLSG